ncbi:hypothetical protein KIPB_005061 [Kipferlia bialata]|uniref:Uncharacterized protein n=1 Tax=Kipferlia bialata TaxID=797122 RepID=A0A9K3CXW3_9EUKA|nr:hypothetical protein KIPB_005061 [Kipferlia bialata]|eukprot:g5061.t1
MLSQQPTRLQPLLVDFCHKRCSRLNRRLCERVFESIHHFTKAAQGRRHRGKSASMLTNRSGQSSSGMFQPVEQGAQVD